MGTSRRPTVLLPGEGKSLNVLGIQFSFKAVAESTGGQYSLFEGLTPPGSGTPLHVHHREDEAFYILDGTFDIVCGDERFVATPGSFALLPRDIPHAFRNIGEGAGKLLGISSPAGLEAFFEHIQLLAANGPPELEKIQALGEKFGVELLGDGDSRR